MNCGSELTPNDAFYMSGGKLIHEVVAVLTPEANVEVPTLSVPQAAAGTGFDASVLGPERRSIWGRVLIGCLNVFVLLTLFVGLGDDKE
ncbi:MAG: hypothetical protein AVDCRST_MAG22-3414 [uncultured Rubrobacteraceae bacterium]|uniref:Uncharacterized protein n=1 Tax=uncultured Rubrobacteraceae bacterium TaxID=349277 RepID=A0A6J4Q8V1_9ACTN|nr:MAG: hypothetical protein AVDCRST_MAG22-3414 [uncultured Rubrobacteraceae bacterium]